VGRARYTRGTLVRELVLIAVAIVYCLPFYLLVAIALETTAQAYKTPLSFPVPPHPGNFAEAWSTGGQSNLGHAMKNSVIITLSSVAGVILLGSLCAYAIARHTGRLSRGLYLVVVLALILPGGLAIIPLYVTMHRLGLLGTYLGMILINLGVHMPFAVFLYTGFFRALPRDYEEAARVDGAGIARTYARVVFPQLWPITAAVALLVGIAVWNEFFLALIFLTGSHAQTLPVALYSFVGGEYVGHQNVIFAGVVIAIAPILAVYVFAHRRLIDSFTARVRG
jgi:raffinose/stachyose/melibiose transport system permease protein